MKLNTQYQSQQQPIDQSGLLLPWQSRAELWLYSKSHLKHSIDPATFLIGTKLHHIKSATICRSIPQRPRLLQLSTCRDIRWRTVSVRMTTQRRQVLIRENIFSYTADFRRLQRFNIRQILTYKHRQKGRVQQTDWFQQNTSLCSASSTRLSAWHWPHLLLSALLRPCAAAPLPQYLVDNSPRGTAAHRSLMLSAGSISGQLHSNWWWSHDIG